MDKINPVNDPASQFYVPIERRRELMEHPEVTLNGYRATIRGATNDFATVTIMPAGLSADFAWETVERIVTNEEGSSLPEKVVNMLCIRDPDYGNEYVSDAPINEITIDIGGQWKATSTSLEI